MAKKTIKVDTTNGETVPSTSSQKGLGDTIGSIGSAVNTIVGAGIQNSQIGDTSNIEGRINTAQNYQVAAGTNTDLMSEWGSYSPIDYVSWRDIRGAKTGQLVGNTLGAAASGASTGATVGGPIGAIVGGVLGLGSGIAGWLTGNRKAKNKASALNNRISWVNDRSLTALEDKASDIDTQNDLRALANFSAYGGPIFSTGAIGYDLASRDLNNKQIKALGDMRLTSLPNSFNAVPEVNTINTFSKGGGIHIKKKNRGKFTDYCGGKVTSECIQRGLHSSNPTTRKRANFARNARKWKHADGGPLTDSQYYDIMEKVADENYRAWGLNSPDEALMQALNDNTYDYRGYYNKYPNSRANADTHWTDEFKTVYHPTFSNESIYSGKRSKFNPKGLTGGHWDGDIFVPSNWQRKKAEGGPLFTHGGAWSNGMTYIDNGGSHEANPFEGVQMGIDPQGVPNLVEEGEVIFNDYVFSDRMKLPKKLKEKYSIKGETFADAAKELSKESEERPNDPISQRGLEAFMSALVESQEEVRIKKEGNKMNTYAKGGKLGKLFEGSGPDDNYLDYGTLTTPVSYEELQGLIDMDSLLPSQDTTNKKKSKLPYLRYAPALMSGISSFMDIFSKPDYSAADRVASVDIQPALVSASPIGQYLSYRPMDRMFYINQLNSNTAAGRRAIQNTTGGNRATMLSSMLASDYTYNRGLGNLARQAEEYNTSLREKTSTFNRATDMFNSQQSMQAQAANAQSRNDATKTRLAQAGEVARLRQAATDAYNNRRSNNLNNFINNLSGIGQEEYARQMINSNPALYYMLSGTGNISYKSDRKKKNGGKLKKGRTYA